jgi:hypothetical protein
MRKAIQNLIWLFQWTSLGLAAMLILFPPLPPAYGLNRPTYAIAIFMAIGMWAFLASLQESPKKTG